jgi:kynurenine formamidase
MKLVDLTHKFSIHTPGWVGYPSPKLSYFQRHATHNIVSQTLEVPLHSGTHFDGEFHIVSGGKDIASIPLDLLCREGVIVDISDVVEDWSVIKPHHITDKMEVKKGDILIYHTPRTRMRSVTSASTRAATASSPSGSSRWSWPGPASTPGRATTR